MITSCMPSKVTNSNGTKKSTTSSSMTTLLPSAIVGPTSVAPEFVNPQIAANSDATTPDCTLDVMAGWKCLNTTITTAEGNTFKVAIKWNRPNKTSVGTVLLAVGGSGMGESRQDPPSKQFMDELDSLDNIRTIELEFTDAPTGSSPWGGYFSHVGGYRSAGYAMTSAIELILSKGLVVGNFLNYMGGSNGSTVFAYAMAKMGIDRYFDRIVFQMGPFLPDLDKACAVAGDQSFTLSTLQQQQSIAELLNLWTFGDKNKSVCSNNFGGTDVNSILKGGRNRFPNSHIHVIIGAKEETIGYGKWILASNLAWYNGIEAKSKSRIIRPNMGHNNSYEDMRRYLKLRPDETPEEAADPSMNCSADSQGTFPADGGTVQWYCNGCGKTTAPASDLLGLAWNSVGGNCFHRKLNPTAPQCSSGQFCANGNIILWNCGCAKMDATWIDQGSTCYHKATPNSCK